MALKTTLENQRRMEIYEWMEAVRVATGWSYSQWARKAGVAVSTVTRFPAAMKKEEEPTPPKSETISKLVEAVPASIDIPIPASAFITPAPPPNPDPTGLEGRPAPAYRAKGTQPEILAEALTKATTPTIAASIPVRATSQADGTGTMTMDMEPVSWIARPDPLLSTRDGWAMYVSVDTMAPSFLPGDTVILNPRRPPFKGRNHLFLKNNGNNEQFVKIALLTDWTRDTWTIHVWSPGEGEDKSQTLSRKAWPTALPIIGKFDG